jgi:hypothetical protein
MQNTPVILVKTWLQLLKSDLEPEAKREVEKKLLNIFGILQLAFDYVNDDPETTI